jgi:hypothetical protein
MNALELMSRLGGETLNNKIRANIDGKIVVLARMIGTEWEYTPEGQELANAHSNAAVEETSKVTKSRKSKDTPVEPAAVELADVAPEL